MCELERTALIDMTAQAEVLHLAFRQHRRSVPAMYFMAISAVHEITIWIVGRINAEWMVTEIAKVVSRDYMAADT